MIASAYPASYYTAAQIVGERIDLARYTAVMTLHDAAVPASGWACFPDGPPPPELVEGFRALSALPRGAQQQLWTLLWLALRDAPSTATEDALQTFCQRFAVHPAGVLAAVRAGDFVLRQAALLGVSSDAFAEDLRRLLGPSDDRSLHDLFVGHFDDAVHYLRSSLLEATLADHGRLLTAFDWRVDRIKLSNRGRQLETDVLFLNLKYRHHDREKQLSLQLTADAVTALRTLLEQISPPRP